MMIMKDHNGLERRFGIEEMAANPIGGKTG
jgi:hypothetical protein